MLTCQPQLPESRVWHCVQAVPPTARFSNLWLFTFSVDVYLLLAHPTTPCCRGRVDASTDGFYALHRRPRGRTVGKCEIPRKHDASFAQSYHWVQLLTSGVTALVFVVIALAWWSTGLPPLSYYVWLVQLHSLPERRIIQVTDTTPMRDYRYDLGVHYAR